MNGIRNVIIRICAIIFYLATFVAIQACLTPFTSTPSAPLSHIFYNKERTPEYFPVLLKAADDSSIDGLLVRSLAMADYGAAGGNKLENQWQIYQDNGEGRLASSSLVSYAVESLSSARSRITLSLTEENRRRVSIYTYEVEDNRIYPREHLLHSYVGDNFSPMPFTVGLTLLIILFAEKIVVKRLKRPRPTVTGAE